MRFPLSSATLRHRTVRRCSDADVAAVASRGASARCVCTGGATASAHDGGVRRALPRDTHPLRRGAAACRRQRLRRDVSLPRLCRPAVKALDSRRSSEHAARIARIACVTRRRAHRFVAAHRSAPPPACFSLPVHDSSSVVVLRARLRGRCVRRNHVRFRMVISVRLLAFRGADSNSPDLRLSPSREI